MYYDNQQEQERAVLVCVDVGDYDPQRSLDELAELAATAGAQVQGRVIQKKAAFDPATLMGSGRLEELRDFVSQQEIDTVIFDHELSPAQQKNLEQALDVKVIDRTTLILDIFAQRARSSEGRLQVELAQLRYRLPRLSGQGTSLSRLGGGIGTRGPGESKLESDRRHIRRRIHNLEEQLKELEQRRGLLRQRRHKDGVISVAIVGYTNVGKSTLLNALTDAGVLAQDMLFATLDPTVRALTLPDGRKVLLVDTVGLVSRLPHHLVEAFHSTLEEAVNADLILNVCDLSSPDFDQQLSVTQEVLRELGAQEVPVLTVLNKCDLVEVPPLTLDKHSAAISARSGLGLDTLLQKIAQNLPETHRRLQLLLPYDKAGLAAEIRQEGQILREDYRPQGLFVDALVDLKLCYKVQDYVVFEGQAEE